jgi:hypothetical protein
MDEDSERDCFRSVAGLALDRVVWARAEFPGDAREAVVAGERLSFFVQAKYCADPPIPPALLAPLRFAEYPGLLATRLLAQKILRPSDDSTRTAMLMLSLWH